ncbi:hypothetical protein EW146_g2713 [Bondarzewia mesenterica]|uniref:Actin-related protein 2/3 complex subunit 5 n=1 Tax=Bondarzewia mesenterica TaxID=1095465 RepID=A0A4S4LZT3_9AGAM|nr:hypothetical protein EW146_g2713 [Bondarzewia mesenterica]
MDVNFRKIDIDAFDEDVLLESELYEPDPRSPTQVIEESKAKAAAVRSSLSKGDIQGALHTILENPPYGPNVEEAKNLTLQTLVTILNSTKATDIPHIVKSLSADDQDALMKYLYKADGGGRDRLYCENHDGPQTSLIGGVYDQEKPGIHCESYRRRLQRLRRNPHILISPIFMHNRPFGTSPKENHSRHKYSQPRRYHSNQHGTVDHSALSLLSLPSESLTHITSFLDSDSLLSLGRVNKRLYEHIKDDNTWHRAFVCQFLGIEPESDLDNVKCLTLRKSEATWKREFISRCHVNRRWSRSRNPTITHVPHHATIDDIHLLSADALLSSSIQYGIVARSFPSTGKVVKGFLNTTGTLHGLGIGNPNAEFAPNVTACALTSMGPSAKVIWGFRDGSVTVMSYPRTMSGNRAAAKVERSRVDEEHRAPIGAVVWSKHGHACVTGSADGVVKVWSMQRFHCAWTLERQTDTPSVGACVEVVEDLSNGIVVGAFKSGEVVVYYSSGFNLLTLDSQAPAQPQLPVRVFRIAAPQIPSANSLEPDGREKQEVLSLFIDRNSYSSGQVSLLASYHNNSLFYRYRINLLSGEVHRAEFGDRNFGPVRCIQTSFSSSPDEPSFVVVGDVLGCLNVYDWTAPSPMDEPISAVQRMEAFSDASVSTIALNTEILAAGSSRGNIKVFNILTLALLRSFHPPVHSIVRKILLNKEMLVASVGSRVVAWKGGVVEGGKNGGKTKGKAKQEGYAKWHKQYELLREIAESRDALVQEARYTKDVVGRERAHLSTLKTLGLSEREAVEYTLMLSREEEERRRRLEALISTEDRQEEEGIFDVDIGDATGSLSDYGRSSLPIASSSHRPVSSSPLSTSSTRPSPSPSQARSHTWALASPSRSNDKVQVSPRFHPEPTEAGELSLSPLTLDTSSSNAIQTVDLHGDEQFPPMSSSSSSSSTIFLSALTTPTRRSTSFGSSTKASPSTHSAWSTSLHLTPSSSPPIPRSTSTPSALQYTKDSSSTARASPEWDEEVEAIAQIEDEELRFALELSLAEARSRTSAS